MNFLYAPWRSHYTNSTERNSTNKDPEACVFCTYVQKTDDAAHFILKRFEHTCVLFNRYPYNAGHLLVIPRDHIATLQHLSKATRAEMMEVATLSTTILEEAMRPHGFNVGFNMGNAAGGSIPTHIHMHVLPRWTGDTNFLPTLSDVKVISYDLVKMYQDLKPRFDKIA